MTTHTGPWNSPLWDKAEDIKTLRRKRTKWKDMPEKLGVNLKPRGIRDFYIRYQILKDNPQNLPAGLEHLITGGNPDTAPQPVQPAMALLTDPVESPNPQPLIKAELIQATQPTSSWKSKQKK